MNPLPRPQRKQRFFARVENFGFFNDRATVDVFAILKKLLFLINSSSNIALGLMRCLFGPKAL